MGNGERPRLKETFGSEGAVQIDTAKGYWGSLRVRAAGGARTTIKTIRSGARLRTGDTGAGGLSSRTGRPDNGREAQGDPWDGTCEGQRSLRAATAYTTRQILGAHTPGQPTARQSHVAGGAWARGDDPRPPE